MGDNEQTPGAAGVGSDIDDSSRRVENVKSKLPHQRLLSAGVRIKKASPGSKASGGIKNIALCIQLFLILL